MQSRTLLPRAVIVLAVLFVAAGALWFTASQQQTTFAQNGDAESGQSESAPIDLGTNTTYVDPRLWVTLQKHADGETVPAKVEIQITSRTDVTMDTTLNDYITSVGGTKLSDHTWRIPTSKALSVIQRADVEQVAHPPGATGDAATTYPRMDDTLNAIMSAYSGGITASNAARYALFISDDKVLLEMEAPNAATVTRIRTWLTGRSVHVPPASEFAAFSDHMLYALVPVSRLAALTSAFPTTYLSVSDVDGQGIAMDRSQWDAELQTYETTVVNGYVASDDADDAAGNDDGGASGSANQGPSTTPTPEPTPPSWKSSNLTSKRQTHGVDVWLGRNLKGNDVKVGIIDWGFYGFETVWNLGELAINGAEGVTKPNAFCQPLDEAVMPNMGALKGSDPCQPSVLGTGINPVDHGTNIAELVRDMAPRADLYVAQANSPRQHYDAAVWLKNQGVDVIVAANGWHYDSLGDGVPAFTSRLSEPSGDTDEHSPYRYTPSPMHTVDTVVKDTSSAPVWINAAGNAELHTLWLDLNSRSFINNTSSKYHGYVIFDSTARQDKDKTCQDFPISAFNVNLYSMRWADSWPNGSHRLEYEMKKKSSTDTGKTYDRSQDVTQNSTGSVNYPFRRSSRFSGDGFDVCLRIKMTNMSSRSPDVPEWVQFQALVARGAFGDGIPWENETDSGRSIVNPAESRNDGLMAMGAKDIRNVTTDTLRYSSRGDVFAATDDITDTNANLTRTKPDAVAGSVVRTQRKYDKKCPATSRICRSPNVDFDEFYFGGTSAATGHTGGIAALVTEFLDDQLDIDTKPATVGDYLRTSAIDKGTSGEDPKWGTRHDRSSVSI